jgi:MYXO-CTERM domain-containing protein
MLLPSFSVVSARRPARIVALTAALASALASFAVAPEAAACDCIPTNEALPTSSSANVPSNTKIWLLQPGCATPTVRKTDGTPVITSTTTVGAVTVLHPDALLEEGSTYEVTGCFGDGTLVTTFTVTAGPDTEPPPAPTFSASNPESSSGGFSSCGSYEYVPLVVDKKDVLLALDIAGRTTLDPKAVSGDVAYLFFPTQSPIVGSMTCGPSTWDFETEGEAIDTRLGAFDLAGNFSGWGEEEAIDSGCSCEVAGANSSPANGCALAGLGLAALALVRRRSRMSSCIRETR